MTISNYLKKILIIAFIALMVSSCRTMPIHSASVSVHGGSSVHHPSRLHSYYYYPDVEVYFDIHRRSYFYFSNGDWRISATLPNTLRLHLGSHIPLELDTLEPYHYHHNHRQHYPRGYFKKKQKDKHGHGNARGRGHYKHNDKHHYKKKWKDHQEGRGYDR